ncbi:glycosyltransferase [Pedobacter petrophilus]|uniref:Glycosyltransferase n=1 Tax=Pedobacter petrophilus TaxID=1908241 RepID=A0A7K0G040_9SPHI|nr:glycosyltransferase family 1 protein [Pedobacter petrophilus]MRX76694.1 glycosyltransferase [Pedobacter petrophilus]
MKIHFDNIIYSLQRAGGISTYWTELISRLLRDQHEVSFTELPHQNISRLALDIPEQYLSVTKGKRVLLNRFKVLPLVKEQDPFIFHSSYNRITGNPHARQVITIHDFVHEKFYRGLRRYLHLYQKNKAIIAAEKIIVVSENTRQDLLHFHPYLKEEHISVIHNGVSDEFYPLATRSDTSSRPYLLFIGSRAYYKNFHFAIDLLNRLTDFDFCIVGSALSAQETLLLNQKIQGRWKMFANIDNQQLNQVYNEAYALIYPSSYEGFGIPLLEVMKTGTPFVALNKSSIPEVAGKAGILVDELDLDAFEQAVLRIQGNEASFNALGQQQASQFSWEKCFQETLQVYHKLI